MVSEETTSTRQSAVVGTVLLYRDEDYSCVKIDRKINRVGRRSSDGYGWLAEKLGRIGCAVEMQEAETKIRSGSMPSRSSNIE